LESRSSKCRRILVNAGLIAEQKPDQKPQLPGRAPKVLVIGGGAAGLTAAYFAAKKGAEVKFTP
jgi:NADPH-dependent 2,4-dienoyl-CoA reductase/sulfur reductase-like enzyme